MRILYYSPHPNLNLSANTGYGTHIREVIAAFNSLGHEVLPVIRGGVRMPEKNRNNLRKRKLKSFIKFFVPAFLWRSFKDNQLIRFDKKSEELLAEEIEKFNPDVIYERQGFLFSSGQSCAARFSLKYWVELNAPLEEEVKKFEGGKSFYTSLGHKILKNNLSHADKIVVVSSALKNFVIANYHIEAKKIIITPNAINPGEININKKKSENLKKKFGVAQSKVIGFTGSVFPYHGVDILIEAFNLICSKRKDVILLIVGDGYLIPNLKKLAATLNIADKVKFTGSVNHDEIYNYIQIMDICVMARSNWYGSPVKIFEYGALAKPIIAPRVIPVQDVMENNVDGILVGPEVSEIKSALEKYLADPNSAEKIGKHFNEKVLANYTWKKIGTAIIGK